MLFTVGGKTDHRVRYANTGDSSFLQITHGNFRGHVPKIKPKKPQQTNYFLFLPTSVCNIPLKLCLVGILEAHGDNTTDKKLILSQYSSISKIKIVQTEWWGGWEGTNRTHADLLNHFIFSGAIGPELKFTNIKHAFH